MLKLTRGALTMLLKEYRSILKNAYLKNIAAGALLAGSLALGSNAYAADPADAIVKADETLDTFTVPYKTLTIEAKSEEAAAGTVAIGDAKSLVADSVVNKGKIEASGTSNLQTANLNSTGEISSAASGKFAITGKFTLEGSSDVTQNQEDHKYYQTKTQKYGDLAVTIGEGSKITNEGTLTIGALTDKIVSGEGASDGDPILTTITEVGKQTLTVAGVKDGDPAVITNSGTLNLNTDTATIYANALKNTGTLNINNGTATIETFVNTGDITVGDGKHNVDATLTAVTTAENTSVINTDNSLTVNKKAVAKVNADSILSNAGTVDVKGELQTGTIVNAKNVTIDAEGKLTAGAVYNGYAIKDAALTKGKDKINDATKLDTAAEATVKVEGTAKFASLNNAATINVNKDGSLTVDGKSTNTSTINIKGTVKEDATKADHIAKATFTGDFVNKSGATLTADKYSDVKFSGAIYNEGTIEAKGTAEAATALDLTNLQKTYKDANGDVKATKGTVNVGAYGVVTATADGLGLVKEKLDKTDASAVKHGTVSVAANGKLVLGDATLEDDVFVPSDLGLHNEGTVEFGTLTLKDADAGEEEENPIFSANAGKIVANALKFSEKAATVTVDTGADVTVKSSLGAAKEVSVAGALNLGADEKASGSVSAEKITSTGTTTVKGTWDLTKTDLDGKFAFVNAKVENAKSIKANGTTLEDSAVSVAGNVNGSIGLTKSTLTVNYDKVNTTAFTSDFDSTLNVNGTVKVDDKTVTKLDVKEDTDKATLGKIYEKLGIKDAGENEIASGFDGILNLASVELTDSNVSSKDNSIKLADINGSLAAHSDLYKTVKVTDVGASVNKDLNVGSLQLAAAGDANIAANNHIVLNKAAAGVEDGKNTVNAFISYKDGDSVKLADAKIANGGSLILNGDGAIGDVAGVAAGLCSLTLNGNIQAGDLTSLADVTVKSGASTAGKVSSTTLTLDGELKVSGDVAATGKASVNGTLTAKNISVGLESVFAGKVTAEENLTANGAGILKINQGEVTAKTATFEKDLNVGLYEKATETEAEKLGIASLKAENLVLSGADAKVEVSKGSSLAVTGADGFALGTNQKLTLGEGSSLNVAKKFTGAYTDDGASVHAADVALTAEQKVKGSLIADKSLTAQKLSIEKTGLVKASEVIATDAVSVKGTLAADTLTASANGISVGAIDNPETADIDENASGILQVQTLNLNDGTLSIDPDYSQPASMVAVNSFAATMPSVTSGSIGIGQNSAFGFGVSSVAELSSALEKAGITSFSKDGIANAMYLAREMIVKSTNGIAMTNDGAATPVADTVDLGKNSAIVIADNLVKNEKTAITVYAGTAGAVKAQGNNKIILGSGKLTKKEASGYQIFNSATGTKDLVDGAENVTVSLNSDFYNDTTLNADGTIGEITVDRVGLNYKLSRASAPIKQLIGDVADVCGNGDGLGSDFIYQQALISAGADVEAAARLATYGGAYQAAQSVQDAGSNAALARLGLGADNSSTVKGDNVSLWTSLTYKTKDSDSFEAEGVDYGADIDLAGIVVGADFTTEKGARLGAFFNLGSGSADGKGVGSSIDNDFDYYGLGFYAGTKLADNFELLGDFSFSQISNELKQNVATYGTLEGDADMTAISAGLIAKYTFNTKVLDVSPYVGVRYSRYDLDSYDVKSVKGTIAQTDAKVQNVLSIPVGLGVSKTFTNGDWTIKPAADVKLTFNSGDKDVDSVTYFTGAPHGSNLSTEVLDDITYGVSAKVDAQYGATTLGIGINYVGSDNTSEFGLGANARYTF